jgi:hypothetical protein
LAAAARATLAAAIAAAVRGVPVLGVSAPPRICDPSVPASPADRYGKEVAETENKAKKKLVSHNNGDFNLTRSLMGWTIPRPAAMNRRINELPRP